MNNDILENKIENASESANEYIPEEYEAEAYEHTPPVEEGPAPAAEPKHEDENRFSPIPKDPVKSAKGAANGLIKTIAISLVCSMLGGMGGAAIINAVTGGHGSSAASDETTRAYLAKRTAVVETVPVKRGDVLTDTQIYAQNVASTVGITTSVTTNFWGFTTTSAASGSGFIYTADGYIITNYHVVENSNSITVTTYDDQSYDASLIGYDESNDVAILKIDAEDLTPVVIGSSSELNIGNHVVAIGNPLGELTFSLTQGAVSSLDRKITLSNGTSMKLIQTDCAINSGNSGGALFNSYGEVIGITNAKYSSSSSGASIDNIGFAIPIDNVLSIINSIIEHGYAVKPYIGVSIATVSEEAKSFGLPAGASVQIVVEGAPADKAGLQVNDIVTSANGEEIKTSSELVAIVAQCQPGDELVLEVYRGGETLTLTVNVAEQHTAAVN